MRVDDRLIHGQVVVGWGRQVQPALIVLANDEVAQNAWEQDLYRMSVPDHIAVEFPTVHAAGRSVERWTHSPQRTIVLLADVTSLEQFCAAAPAVHEVNLGGIHREPDRRQCLPYVFLTDDEATMLRGLAARGVHITAQDLPGTPPVELEELLT